MGKKKMKNKVKYDVSTVPKEKLVDIYAEAYYKALKKIDDEKTKTAETREYKWYENILFFLNVFLWPWKINKRFKINNQVYDSILTLTISFFFSVIGDLLWLYGILVIISGIYQLISTGIVFKTMIGIVFLSIISLLLGSLFILSGEEFGKETDSNKIYAFSASVIAMVSCIISVIALLKS